MRIIPAILAETVEDFVTRLKQAESFSDYVQIDIMDGIFVPTKSFPAEAINYIHTPLFFEIHLMVKEPSAVMEKIRSPNVKKAIFHFESDVNYLDFVRQMKKRCIAVGMAVKPETRISSFRDLAENIDIFTLMFLTVDPCCYGNPFRLDVLKKIEEARSIFRNKVISVDGGISLENLNPLFAMGVDYVCVGSRIFLSGNPRENYQLFLNKVAELERGKQK